MCILFLAINQHPDHPLIVAANRDEAFDRPSRPMHYWPDCPEVLAGRDSLKGGSWLGVNLQGQFCAVTNFRSGDPANENAKSRGELVHRYLHGQESNSSFIRELQEDYTQYNPFNLVFGNPKNISVFSSETASLHNLDEGFHSLSNGQIDQHWPKMSYGVQRLTELIDKNSDIEVEELNLIMRDETRANEADLPNTGVSRDLERHLSAIFIRGTDYGTRTTSYLLYSHSNIQVYEINYDSHASVTDQQAFTVDLTTN